MGVRNVSVRLSTEGLLKFKYVCLQKHVCMIFNNSGNRETMQVPVPSVLNAVVANTLSVINASMLWVLILL